jgi:hypothetical protein
MIRAIQIDRDVVVLKYQEQQGKVVLGPLRVLPVGVFQNLKTSYLTR